METHTAPATPPHVARDRKRPGPAPSPDRAARIVGAARTCFERWGVERTRMDDIAKEAGVPRPALYRHFASKDALVLEVMVEHIRRRGQELHEKLPPKGPSGPVILQALLTGVLEPAGDRVSESVLGIGVLHDTAALVARSGAIAHAMRDYWLPYLQHAEQRGELRAGVQPLDAVRWLTLVVFYLLAVPEVAPDPAELARYLETFVVGAIVTDAS